MEIIVREVVTLQGMVDEFSRYARMPRPRPAPVDLARLVGETVHLYRNLKPGVEVEGDVDAGLTAVWIDAEQIKRALINLLDNAVEATEAPGRVRVAAHPVNGHLEIQVADTGRGIPPDIEGEALPPLLLHQGARHRPRPRHRPPHRHRPPGGDPGGGQRAARDGVHGGVADRVMKGGLRRRAASPTA